MDKISTHVRYPGIKISGIPLLLILLIMTFLPLSLYGGYVSGTFTTLANCPMKMTSFTVDPTTGYFYGQGDRSENYYRYNPTTNTWSALASCPLNAGNNGGATYLNGKIYNSYCSNSTITVYDIATNTWSTISGGFATGKISTDGTDIYICGNGVFKKYVLASSSWTSLTGLSYSDQPWGGLQYINGYFYHHSGNGSTPFDRYEVATDTWTSLDPVPAGAVLGSAIFDAYYYCQGPYGGTNLYSYDLGAQEWNNTLTLPFTTNDAAIVTYNNSLYIVQGEAGTGFTRFTPNNPILTGIEGAAITYTLGNPAANITSTLVASQSGGTNFVSATVSITNNFESGKDVLSFVDANGITGSWNSATGVLTLSGTSTIANYQAALRSVKYSNSDISSGTGARTVSMQVYNGSVYSNTASRDIMLTIPSLLTTSVSSITLTSASSGGTISSEGEPTVSARGVCWNTSGTPTLSDSHTEDGTGTGSFTSSLTGLSEGTTYYVRAYSTISGITYYGNERSFSTLSTSISGSTGGTAVATNSPVYIAGAATISSTLTLDGASVSIYNNYSSSQDVLGIDGSTSGTMGSISYSYNSANGILTLTGSASAADYQAIIRKVTYSNTASTPETSDRSIKISLNAALSFDGNGHFYEYVTSPNITWAAAKTAASNMRYFGLQGYLVTITSAEESAFCASKLLGQGWLGASDEASEGTWRWVAGPENGNVLTYTHWNSGEPNDAGGNEDCAQFLANGLWNDLSSTATLAGFVVEYGGMAGDPELDISDNVTVNFSIPTATEATNIEAEAFTANWTAVSGAGVYFLDVATNSSFTTLVSGYNNKDIGNVTTYNVTGLNPNTVYYYRIRATIGAGTSFNSSVQSLTTLKRTQTITFGALDDVTYGVADFDLTATASSGLTVTYASSNTGVAVISGSTVTVVGAGNTTITASQSGNSSYYAASDVQQTLTADKATLTVTADNQTKVYGDANPALTFQYSGFVNGDDEEDITTEPVAATTVSGTTVVGVYSDAITLTGGVDENYGFDYVAGDFEVTKAELTVTADDQTKVYGDANPTLTFQYSGFMNGDDEEDITTEPVASTTVSETSSVNVYTDDITLAGGDDENYSFTYVAGDFGVTKATLTVTADDKTKIYGESNPVLTFQYSGFVNGDDEEDLTAEPVASTTVSETSSVNVYTDDITLAGGDDENYSFSYVAADFEVTKATLTVTADGQTKVYGDANPALTFQYSGFVNGDDEEDITTEPVAATTVSGTTVVGVYSDAITLTGGVDENYGFDYVAGDFEVTKAELTVTADDQTKVYGDANPTLTFQYSGFMNGDDEEDITTEPVASTTVSETSSVNVYTDDITLAGGDDENYSFTYVAGDFGVTKATLTVTADDKTKIYGESNPVLTFQYSGFVNGDDEEDLTAEPVASTTVSETSSVNVYTDDITLAGGDDENYSFSYVAADFEVTKATLTVTADGQTKVYGDANPALTFQYSGFVNGDDEEDLTTEPVASTTVSETTPVNIYTDDITLAGGDDENYSFSYIAADFEVTKAELTVTANAQTKVYGDANPTLTFQYSGFVNGDDEEDLTTEPVASTTVSETTSVGTYTNDITLAGGDDENYSFSYIAADFEITKAELTVTANAQTKIYGDANPTLTFQYSGFMNGDDEEGITTEPVAATTVTETTSVGVYADDITLAGGDDENYSFAYVAADFEVTKAELTVTADAQTKVYGDANPTLSFQYSGFVNSDDEEDLTTEPVASTTVSETSSVNVYTDDITLAGGDDENYSFTYVAADFEITKATLTVTADDQTKIYGEANPALTFRYSGFVNDDDVEDLTVEPVTSTIVSEITPVGAYTEYITLAGGDDENYSFAYVAGDFEVTKATLTVTVDNQTKIYGEANPTLTFQYSGFMNDDNEEYLTTEPVSSTTVSLTTPVGEYTDVITLAGGVDGNYSFSYVAADFEVTKATLTVTADDKTKVYGDDNPALSFQYSGFANDDDEEDLTAIPVAASTITETSSVGVYTDNITLAGGDDENYSFEYVAGDFEVTKATLTARAESKTKIYGYANPELTIRYTGFKNEDAISDIDVLPVAATEAEVGSDAGMYDITVSGGEDADYMFDYINGNMTIDKADQEIAFESIPEGLRMTEQYRLNAAASSGLTVRFESSDPYTGSVSGDMLTINADKTFSVTAYQDGDHNWNPAQEVIQWVTGMPTFDNIMSLFTPNNDGMNDYWYITDIEEYGNVSVTIYNRFGVKVYESGSYHNNWDGTWNGKQLPSASYYYIIKSENKGTISGAVNLVR